MDAAMQASSLPADALSPDSEYVDLAAEVFSLLSDPTRIRLILALEDGELPVGELAERVGKAPTAVSQHLAKLRWAKVVQTRQEGTRVYYSLIDEHARELVHQAVFQAEHVIDFWPRHHRPDTAPSAAQ
ncbi:MAG: metalloregulator ArsR/SmtB family transcription factor [Propionicimonas sp.]|uniref:ArsR/SmtB family transcription factor n=1 Tax=Propionicimonas sp. TaxID=1955623 RepID=UPI003D13DA5E